MYCVLYVYRHLSGHSMRCCGVFLWVFFPVHHSAGTVTCSIGSDSRFDATAAFGVMAALFGVVGAIVLALVAFDKLSTSKFTRIFLALLVSAMVCDFIAMCIWADWVRGAGVSYGAGFALCIMCAFALVEACVPCVLFTTCVFARVDAPQCVDHVPGGRHNDVPQLQKADDRQRVLSGVTCVAKCYYSLRVGFITRTPRPTLALALATVEVVGTSVRGFGPHACAAVTLLEECRTAA